MRVARCIERDHFANMLFVLLVFFFVPFVYLEQRLEASPCLDRR